MRSFYNPDKFFRKMKKKPAQQEVLDNIQNYTVEEIKNLSGPHFPAWIKDELIKYKNRNGNDSEQIANEIAAQMTAASQKKLV